MESGSRNPIFILGVTQRTGTNYLYDLVGLHPDCAPGRQPIGEDYFLHESDLLLSYVSAVEARWVPEWGDYEPDVGERLLEALGRGLMSFLTVDPERRLVTKTPSVRHVDRFFRLFPEGKLLLLVRDGRAVAWSSMATFGWDFDFAVRAWREGAETVRRLQTGGTAPRGGTSSRYRLVRYEDLLDRLEETMTSVLEYLDLDQARYDFSAASNLSVRGSSDFFGDGHDRVHWNPIDPDARFQPKERWREWEPARLERFDWLAGDLLRHFGYPPAAGRPGGIAGAMTNRALDVAWGTRHRVRKGSNDLRVRWGPLTRPLRRRLSSAAHAVARGRR